MRALKAIVVGGVAAGVLDILYAFVVYGPLSYQLSPLQVLQSIAAGWMGREAASGGGWETGVIGLGSHFLIALVMAAVFVLAATRIRAFAERPWLWGFVYGLILYVAMNYVVVPLSASATGAFATSVADAAERLQTAFSALRPRDPFQLVGTIFTHTAFVGIPIALAAKRYLARD